MIGKMNLLKNSYKNSIRYVLKSYVIKCEIRVITFEISYHVLLKDVMWDVCKGILDG